VLIGVVGDYNQENETHCFQTGSRPDEPHPLVSGLAAAASRAS
jgi:hypothetical protein